MPRTSTLAAVAADAREFGHQDPRLHLEQLLEAVEHYLSEKELD